MAYIKFSKMHGLGNDFVVIDAITQKVNLKESDIRFLANRHLGIGCDQLLLIEAPNNPEADFRYRIYNQNGSEVEHCGNGARCFVKFIHNKKLSGKNPLIVETQKGMITLLVKDNGDVKVNMGVPHFDPQTLPFNVASAANSYRLTNSANESIEFGVVSVGNPHAVIRVDNVNKAPVDTWGPFIESHSDFPQGVNVGFLDVRSRQEVHLRVFERGAGETNACGTGACAAVAYARQQNWVDASVTVHLKGGSLVINYDQEGQNLYMTGSATHVYNGNITL